MHIMIKKVPFGWLRRNIFEDPEFKARLNRFESRVNGLMHQLGITAEEKPANENEKKHPELANVLSNEKETPAVATSAGAETVKSASEDEQAVSNHVATGISLWDLFVYLICIGKTYSERNTNIFFLNINNKSKQSDIRCYIKSKHYFGHLQQKTIFINNLQL